jgi:hypothetical protein
MFGLPTIQPEHKGASQVDNTPVKRKPMIAVSASTVFAMALIIWPFVRVNKLEHSFSLVNDNDAKSLVLERMGPPWKDEGCGQYLGGQPTGCAEEFIYAHPFAPYVPEYWVVDFGSNHRVINHVHLVSP